MANGNNLHLQIYLPGAGVRRWQTRVVEVLAARSDVTLGVVRVEAPDPIAGLDLLFGFDRLFVGRGETTAADRVDEPIDRAPLAMPDLALDLVGDADGPAGVPLLRPLCLGRAPLEGALAAALEDRPPVLSVLRLEAGADPREVERWAVAVEDRSNTLRAVSQTLGRLVHMAVVAVLGARSPNGAGRALVSAVAPARPRFLAAPAALTRSLGVRVLRRLDRLLRDPPDWRVITRRRDPSTDPLAPERDPTPFRRLADDGRRFYADPFVRHEAGRTWLFVEEFPYATGRGVLSVAEIDADGTVASPRPFLEESCHLSYPQIFSADGEIWMVPETSGRRTVELWRAVAFPDRWEKHAVLVDDADLGDATLLSRDDGWWMFACRREPWCSSWDGLEIRRAPHLLGPWREIALSPAKVDVASARPAGAMIVDDGALLRPVQDSAGGYGRGLALTRVERLDGDGFAEREVKRFRPPPPLAGLHTWNRAATPRGIVEAMDVFARADAFGPVRRLDFGVTAPERSFET